MDGKDQKHFPLLATPGLFPFAFSLSFTFVTYRHPRGSDWGATGLTASEEGARRRVGLHVNRWRLLRRLFPAANLPVSNEVGGLSAAESRRHPLVSSIAINVGGLLIIP